MCFSAEVATFENTEIAEINKKEDLPELIRLQDGEIDYSLFSSACGFCWSHKNLPNNTVERNGFWLVTPCICDSQIAQFKGHFWDVMGTEGQLTKLSYHCKPFNIRSKYLSLQQKMIKWNEKRLCVVTQVLWSQEEPTKELYRFGVGPGEWWCFPWLVQHGISLLTCVWHVWRGEVRHVPLMLPAHPPRLLTC